MVRTRTGTILNGSLSFTLKNKMENHWRLWVKKNTFSLPCILSSGCFLLILKLSFRNTAGNSWVWDENACSITSYSPTSYTLDQDLAGIYRKCSKCHVICITLFMVYTLQLLGYSFPFVYSLNRYLLRIYYVPGTILIA